MPVGIGEPEVRALARKEKQEPVYARALVLAPLAGPGAEYVVHATLLIELPDGTLTVGHPAWKYTLQFGVIRPGTWIPVILPPGEPDSAELNEDHVPSARDVGAVIAEALGGPKVNAIPPDEWRVGLALAYAERIITGGAFTPGQAEAIRQRIRLGV